MTRDIAAGQLWFYKGCNYDGLYMVLYVDTAQPAAQYARYIRRKDHGRKATSYKYMGVFQAPYNIFDIHELILISGPACEMSTNER